MNSNICRYFCKFLGKMYLFLYTDLIHDFFILLHRLIITKTITKVKRKSDFSSKFREFNRKIRKISCDNGTFIRQPHSFSHTTCVFHHWLDIFREKVVQRLRT